MKKLSVEQQHAYDEMERVTGTALSMLIDGGPLTVASALEVAGMVSAGAVLSICQALFNELKMNASDMIWGEAVAELVGVAFRKRAAETRDLPHHALKVLADQLKLMRDLSRSTPTDRVDPNTLN